MRRQFFSLHHAGASSAAVPGQLTLGVTDVLCNGTEENITACVGDTTQLETLRCRQHANVVCLGE